MDLKIQAFLFFDIFFYFYIMLRKPKIGEDVYCPTALHVYRGRDDFHGGLCKIKSIEKSKTLPPDHYNYCFVEVEERPGVGLNWRLLMEQQEELAAEFGNERGYMDPDDRPEFNDDNEGWQTVHSNWD